MDPSGGLRSGPHPFPGHGVAWRAPGGYGAASFSWCTRLAPQEAEVPAACGSRAVGRPGRRRNSGPEREGTQAVAAPVSPYSGRSPDPLHDLSRWFEIYAMGIARQVCEDVLGLLERRRCILPITSLKRSLSTTPFHPLAGQTVTAYWTKPSKGSRALPGPDLCDDRNVGPHLDVPSSDL